MRKTAAAVGALFAGLTAMSTPIDVGDRLQLLWDDHLVDAEKTTATRLMHTPRFAGTAYVFDHPSKAFHAVNGYALRRMARHLNHRGQRRYRLKFADTYYGELNYYGMHWLRWADVRRRRY